MPPPKLSAPLDGIDGVKLSGSSSIWDIKIEYPSFDCAPDAACDLYPVARSYHGIIKSITPHKDFSEAEGRTDFPLVLPALTHPHIHLDKAFIHNDPKCAHLLPCSGSFPEALAFTTKAKQESFSTADIRRRGEWLLAESVSSGVTAMRAFVEVDHTVSTVALEAAVQLKNEWKDVCHIQIVSFAQDPIFSTEHGDENRKLMEMAIERTEEVDVLGTTPYVESTIEAAKQNIEWAIDYALRWGKHVDFHLDYNLDASKEPLVWHVLHTLKACDWSSRSKSRVMLGHCTRLTLLTDEEWREISDFIHENHLPVSFVGLPTSDLYMAAPPTQETPHQRPRGTLHVPDLIRKHNLDAVMGINNVGNAFTPWGSADPLSLASLGVGIYQAGSQEDAELLYECVSTRARAAIGVLPPRTGPMVQEGTFPDLILFHDRDDTGCGVSRPRTSVAEVVWDPPIRTSRSVVTANGRVQLAGSKLDESIFRFMKQTQKPGCED